MVILLLLFPANAVHFTYHRGGVQPCGRAMWSASTGRWSLPEKPRPECVITRRVRATHDEKASGYASHPGSVREKDFKALLPNGPRFLQSARPVRHQALAPCGAEMRALSDDAAVRITSSPALTELLRPLARG